MLGLSQYLVVVTLFTCFIPPYASSDKHDCLYLLEISQTLSPPSPPLNWSSHTFENCCHWEGVACDSAGRVARLSLPSRGLTGHLSPSLANLTHLSYLNLSQNRFVGSLPDRPLPASIHTIDLSNNKFQGPITTLPFSLAWNLLSFNVRNNSFTGNLPSPICANASLLKHLDFSSNQFSGKIPQGLMGRCSKMEIFSVGNNFLSGLLPPDLYNASALLEMSLQDNGLSGNIREDIVCLENLTKLELYYNKLSGPLPQQLGSLPRLETLLLNANYFSGTLPMSLMNCTTLQKLILRSNLLEGELSTFNFSKLVELRTLDLGLNNFSGQLPSSLYSCKSLRALRLSFNRLEGQIQPDIIALRSLSYLAVAYTKMTNISGAIKILMGSENLRILILGNRSGDGEAFPDDKSMVGIDGFPKLQLLLLAGWELSGEVPNWVCKLSNSLEFLDLSSNKLQGPIPTCLGNFPKLFFLDLSDNLFSGQFPLQLCGLPALTSGAEAENTLLEIPLFFPRKLVPLNKSRDLLYPRISSLQPTIFLRNNSFTGSIPGMIGQLRFLHMLDLSCNRFQGSIPDQLSKITNLEYLDLSGNGLSGTIPAALRALTFLNAFNVSNNHLSGKIPGGGQLQSFNASAYEGNPELCGQPLENECSNDKGDGDEAVDDGDDNDDAATPLYLCAGFGYFTGFVIVCVTGLLKFS